MFESLKRWWVAIPVPVGPKVIMTIVVLFVLIGLMRRLF
jgi:hypothetical protein